MDINPQQYAVGIEKILRNVFDCDRGGFGGVANSDFIRRNPVSAMLVAMGYLYTKSENQEEIEAFIRDNSLYINMSIDDMLKVESSTKTENVTNIDIRFKNGKDAIESITKNFKKICSEK